MPGEQQDAASLLTMTRAQLHAHVVDYYKTGSATVPDVALVACGQTRAVLKDYGRMSGWFARLLAPLLIWREARALAALAAVPGVPRLYRRVDARALLIEYCPATAWPKASPGDEAYEHLAELIGAMHEHGVAHCDLRGGSNILVDADDQPYLVDFVSHIRKGQKWNLPWNWLFRRFVMADRSALSKLRIRYAEHLASDADYRLRDPDDVLSRWARSCGQAIRRMVRLLQRKDEK